MATKKRASSPRIALKSPKDGRRLIRRVLAQIFHDHVEVESAGKIANLLTVWAKLWELDELKDIERRIANLEEKAQEDR